MNVSLQSIYLYRKKTWVIREKKSGNEFIIFFNK